jgi:hypothetical protein
MPEPITTTSAVCDRASPVACLGRAADAAGLDEAWLDVACRARDCHLAPPRVDGKHELRIVPPLLRLKRARDVFNIQSAQWFHQ